MISEPRSERDSKLPAPGRIRSLLRSTRRGALPPIPERSFETVTVSSVGVENAWRSLARGRSGTESAPPYNHGWTVQNLNGCIAAWRERT